MADFAFTPRMWVLFAISVAGFASSAWMLAVVSRGPVSLLKRQLFHQAVATLVLNILKIGLMITALVDGDGNCFGETTIGHITDGTTLVLHGLFFVTCLADLHIAASLAATSWRAPQSLRRLDWCLPGIWPLAVGYVLAWVLTTESIHTRDVQYSYFGPSIILVSFVLTFVFYAASLWGSSRFHAPNIALRRIRRRGLVFPLLFMIIGVPTCARYFRLVPACSTLEALTFVLDHAEGVLNALAYWLLSGAPQQPTVSHQTELGKTPRPLKAIGFTEDVEVQTFSGGGSWRRAAQWSNPDAELDNEVALARGESSLDAQGEGETGALWREYVGW